MTDQPTQEQESTKMEGGAYGILRQRLETQGQDLRKRLNQLNKARKEVFGSIEARLLSSERITTSNNCTPWDMVPVGPYLLFGYNVHMGLKAELALNDVFSVYRYEDHQFHDHGVQLIRHEQFERDFQQLYTYYKETVFVRFAEIGPHLFMIFRVGKKVTDIKTFKWAIEGDSLRYLDNRSDHEYRFPDQHEFRWRQTRRDQHVAGKHPHVNIEDKVFVETIGGDLTIKVENNTDEGRGIYAEPVENADQTLADASISYAVIGNLIALKILPYKEEKHRYIIFNHKVQEARRIDDLEHACVLLPDDHGVIFANGYYLQTGEFKLFENGLQDMLFERKIVSPNGEDYLYVFYNRARGLYLLLPYNIIRQSVDNPIICHGYSIFENGELIYFRGDDEPKKHHAVQIWQTPFVGPNFEVPTSADNYLSKIGNKEIVRAMAECMEILNLLGKDESYDSLYVDLIRRSTDLADSYHWLNNEAAFTIGEPLSKIREASTAAVEEYEKVQRIRKNTRDRSDEIFAKADEIEKEVKRARATTINDYVQFLSSLRAIRGEVISLKELRYSDTERIDARDASLDALTQEVSKSCVNFLLKDKALAPYEEKVGELDKAVEKTAKVVDARELDEQIGTISTELEMLIEVVSNLEIEDATETTRIIDNISAVYASFNQTKAALKNKKQELLRTEGEAEFNSQLKLIDQGVINYLDICDTPEKCEEFQTKLMVQLEELEGRFSEFDGFVDQISRKREEVYDAFDARKVQLTEERNRRATTLMSAATRIIKAVKSRVARFKEVNEINGYFASDIMIGKARDIVKELRELGDNVKAEDISSQLKSAKEEALRQLKDKSELFVDGEDLIKMGRHQFAVNTQNLALSMVPREEGMYFHLTGTNFYEEVKDEAFLQYSDVWEQSLVSENKQVYRAEYLAYQMLHKALSGDTEEGAQVPGVEALYNMPEKELQETLKQFMATRFQEGYVKGVHDHDARLLLQAMLRIVMTADLLRFNSRARACALLCWDFYLPAERRETLLHQLKGVGAILKVFPGTQQFDRIRTAIYQEMAAFVKSNDLFEETVIQEATDYLFEEIARGDDFVIDAESEKLYESFFDHLKTQKHRKVFDESVAKLEGHFVLQYNLVLQWLEAYIREKTLQDLREYIPETAALIMSKRFDPKKVIYISLRADLEGFKGTHKVLDKGRYAMDYNVLMHKLRAFAQRTVPRYLAFQETKKTLVDTFSEDLRLEEFRPRVMSSFVRNRLIDEVYLPMIGDNLAKQIGAAGEGKRTDLMGMLLLLSPPGYGKTTLMEYIANRLGIIFMKINGPAIGHNITSIDPSEAGNAAAREELQKLNLAFEMGDNVMIYLDDIQHCNPELLQKFISLCDAQRKIEGVYKGKPRTYDFRGKKVAVVMAGNPYTESGEKFQIPDMLANRADIYNLGDIIGGADKAFELSYLENCLTSNAVLNQLATRSRNDVRKVVQVAETGQREGIEWEANHSNEELSEYIGLMEKLLKVRNIVLRVNQEYIRSAAQADEYRTEPPFKLQGSYRNMNKLAEKLNPVMNEEELETLILSHYENESQTLTSGAEANLLKFKELYGKLSTEEAARWDSIKTTFAKNNRLKGLGGNELSQVIDQMEGIGNSLMGINRWLTGSGGDKEIKLP